MAVLSILNPTLLDFVKRQDPDGSMAQVVELLTQENAVLGDATAIEGNLPTGHRTTIRSGLPTIGWRRINEGVPPSKSHTLQVDEICGLMEGYSEIDTELVELNGGPAFRASEDAAFVSKMNNEAASALFYANTETAPEKFTGFSPRYDAISGNTQNSINIIKPGYTEADEQASMWLICWAPDTCHLIFPKGTMAGLQSKDLGEQVVRDTSGNLHTAWVTKWTWKLGLCIRDWRYVVRICNIDISQMATPANNTKLVDAMTSAYYRLPTKNKGRMAFYANAAVLEALEFGMQEKVKNTLNYHDFGNGVLVPTFKGIPIKQCDALTVSETIIS
jgi:hypothetical protein